MTTTALDLPVVLPRGAECTECVEEFGDELKRLRGVRGVTADVTRGLLHVSFDNQLLAYDDLIRDARRIGAAAHCAAHCPRDAHGECGCELVLDPSAADRYEQRLAHVTGLDCADCALKLEGVLRHTEGIVSATTSFGAATLKVVFDPGEIAYGTILEQVRRLGYDTLEGRQARDTARERAGRGHATQRSRRPRSCRPRPRRIPGEHRRRWRADAARRRPHHAHGDRRRGGGGWLCRRGPRPDARAVPVRRGHGDRRCPHGPRRLVLAARALGRHERADDDRRHRRGRDRPVERGRPRRLSLLARQPAAVTDHGAHAPRRARPRRARPEPGPRRRRRPCPHGRRRGRDPRRPRARAARRAPAGRRPCGRRPGRGRPVAGHRRVDARRQDGRRRCLRRLDRPGRRPDRARHDERRRQHDRQDHPPGRGGASPARSAADLDRPLRRQVHADRGRGGGRGRPACRRSWPASPSAPGSIAASPCSSSPVPARS